MRYQRFGKTELPLSVFSLGVMGCLASFVNFRQTIEQAIALGINHLETARGYGKSEEYLGLVLQEGLSVPREQLYITTKLPPTPDGELMWSWIHQSLHRLQLDYIDCLAIHGINTWKHLSYHGCRVLRALKRRFIGQWQRVKYEI